VKMDGSRAINHITSLVAVVKGRTYGVDVQCKRLAWALSKHEVTKQ
jgi:hypothetical protein